MVMFKIKDGYVSGREVFLMPDWLHHMLSAGRILFKKTVEAYMEQYMQTKVDQVLQEHRLVSLITQLRGTRGTSGVLSVSLCLSLSVLSVSLSVSKCPVCIYLSVSKCPVCISLCLSLSVLSVSLCLSLSVCL